MGQCLPWSSRATLKTLQLLGDKNTRCSAPSSACGSTACPWGLAWVPLLLLNQLSRGAQGSPLVPPSMESPDPALPSTQLFPVRTHPPLPDSGGSRPKGCCSSSLSWTGVPALRLWPWGWGWLSGHLPGVCLSQQVLADLAGHNGQASSTPLWGSCMVQSPRACAEGASHRLGP